MENESLGKLGEDNFVIKVVLFGDGAVGKSSLLLRYIDCLFEDNYYPTVGADFEIKALFSDGERIILQIWDTAGQERFKAITKCYYRGFHGCAVIFDLTNKLSFSNVRNWISEFRESNTADLAGNIVVIGNKIDKEEERVVTVEEAQSMAQSLNVYYTETSAKSGDGVDQAFKAVAKVILKNL